MPRTGRQPQKGLELRDCVVCGTRFQPYRDFHVACGQRSCRAKAKESSPRREDTELVCKYCGATFVAPWSGVGRRPPCPECHAKREAERSERKNVARRVSVNPARREINLRYNLRQYGITPDEYRARLLAQDGECAVCGAEPDAGGVKAAARLHVDHDHVTGRLRDLLCVRCNQGVGYFRDDPTLLRAMAEYIERHRSEGSL